MIEIKKLDSLDDLWEFKKNYFSQSTAPLDGMWHFGFVSFSTHYGFYEKNALVGYCCINSDGYILQFYLSSEAKTQESILFDLIADNNSSTIGTINGAFASTAEPKYLSLCLDFSKKINVNALMFMQMEMHDTNQMKDVELKIAESLELKDFVSFAVNNLQASEQWLLGYYDNLINRNELWGYWINSNLIAIGECRLFDNFQTEYAELGIVVAQSERSQGVATQVLIRLMRIANEQGLIAICSTEKNNIGARKAIYRAGMRPMNRIIQFDFE